MIQFAEVFPDNQITQSLIAKLGWTHILLLLPIQDRLKREFYAEMRRLERWSARTLRAKIGGMLYELAVLSGKAEQVIDAEIASLRETDQLTPNLIFRDPYLLNVRHATRCIIPVSDRGATRKNVPKSTNQPLTERAHEEDFMILSQYQAEYRGYVQSYQMAVKLVWLNRLCCVMQSSLLKTLAAQA